MMLKIVLCAYVRSEFSWEINLFCSFLVRHFVFCFFFFFCCWVLGEIYKIFSSFGLLDNIFWLSMVYVSSFLPITTWLLCNYFECYRENAKSYKQATNILDIFILLSLIFNFDWWLQYANYVIFLRDSMVFLNSVTH